MTTKTKQTVGRLLTTNEAVEVYRKEREKLGYEPTTLAPTTLRVHVHNGNIEAIKLGSNVLLFERGVIRRFAKRNNPGSNPFRRSADV